MPNGKLIVIEGIDGSGKSVQTEALAKKLDQENLDVIISDYPRYENGFWGKLVGKMLTGELGDLFGISPYLAVLPYMLDEADGSKKIVKPALAQGKIVISNRYFTSNVHQIAKLPLEQREKYAAWLWEAGYSQMEICKPDLVIVLLVDENICRENILNKMGRHYTNGKLMDQAEENLNHQMESAKEYIKTTEKQPDIWSLIECSKSGDMLPKEEISDKVYKKVKKIL